MPDGTSAAERYQSHCRDPSLVRNAASRSADGRVDRRDRPGRRMPSEVPRSRPHAQAAGSSSGRADESRRCGPEGRARPHLSRELPRSATMPEHALSDGPERCGRGGHRTCASGRGSRQSRRRAAARGARRSGGPGGDALAGDGRDREDLAAELRGDPLARLGRRRSGPAWSRPGPRAGAARAGL